ncbi:MAG: hypothetical protein QG629_692 [Patescibacteria group bacterium]|nr:hypothetical protein [Candidatus Saccharibacteria bacterium]MDQ5963609.1 hypothetical protein [Patescibacteria group bacterium]
MKQDGPNGAALIADFQSVVLTLATKDAAVYEANRSEKELMEYLTIVSHGSYLQPATLAQDEQQRITQASVDAHLKKAQADQVLSMSEAQIAATTRKMSSEWKGKKIRLRAVDATTKPFRGHYFDPRHGSRLSNVNVTQVAGVVEEVLPEKNVLILRPTLMSRWSHSGLQAYIITMVDPVTFVPFVVPEA